MKVKSVFMLSFLFQLLYRLYEYVLHVYILTMLMSNHTDQGLEQCIIIQQL